MNEGNFVLDKSQRLVAKAVAKDESRPVLTCVHIRKGIIEAADGFVSVQKEIDYDGEELLIKGKDLAKCKGEAVIFSKVRDGEIRATGKELIILKTQEGAFPDVDKLYPKLAGQASLVRLGGTKPFRIAFSRTNLLKLLKALGDEEIVRFHFYGAEKVMELETATTKGLIMPMIIDWEFHEKEA